MRSEESGLRPKVTDEELNTVIKDVQRKLAQTLNEKGSGAFSSRHEILGVIREEFREFEEAIHSGHPDQIMGELMDMVAPCIFAIACVRFDKTEW